ncbi:MAG: N-acetyltransferase family protein [Bacteroidota bacterium]
MLLRQANINDIRAITDIYNDAVINTVATFDIDIKSNNQMLAWLQAHDEKYCVIVCEVNNEIAGWASLTRYSDRIAYDRTAEFSIYFHPDYKGKKLSKPLMAACIQQGQQHGVKAILARITEGNQISIKLHEHFGFFMVGTMKQVGVKFNQVLDVHLMQLLVK